MAFFAIVFAVLMLAATLGAGIFIWVVAGWTGAMAFVVFCLVLYRLAARSGPPGALRQDQLNAFQQPLSDDWHKRPGRRPR